MADYPTLTFHFSVDLGGSTPIGFSEASGFDFTIESADYATGDQQEYSNLKIPGRKTWGEITLKKGMFAGDNTMYDWWNTVKMGTIDRRDITISLLDETHSPLIVYTIKNAWPSKVQSASLKADATEVAIETMTITHEGIVQENLG